MLKKVYVISYTCSTLCTYCTCCLAPANLLVAPFEVKPFVIRRLRRLCHKNCLLDGHTSTVGPERKVFQDITEYPTRSVQSARPQPSRRDFRPTRTANHGVFGGRSGQKIAEQKTTIKNLLQSALPLWIYLYFYFLWINLLTVFLAS